MQQHGPWVLHAQGPRAMSFISSVKGGYGQAFARPQPMVMTYSLMKLEPGRS